MKTLLLYLTVLFLLINHQSVIIQNQAILYFFMENLLPSLFILCLLVVLLPFPMNVSFKFLGFEKGSFALFMKMLFLGNPAGSYFINTLTQENKLTLSQGKRLVFCVSIPSLSYMFMSIAYLKDMKTALLLFTIHVLSILILLFITRKESISFQENLQPFVLQKAILFTIRTMAFILAYLFIAVSVKSIVLIYFPFLSSLIHLTAEFSSGIDYFKFHEHFNLIALVCIGFGGFCSHLQILSGCESLTLRYRDYVLWRLLHVIFNVLIYLILKGFRYILLFF